MQAIEIASFLRAIPQSNQNAVPLVSLAPHLDACFLQGYVTLLQTIGMVILDEQGHIKASSQTAKYSLNCLAAYVEHDQQWIADWKTRGVHRHETGALQNGATFLYELEKRRLALSETPIPSRIEEVAQVFIVRHHPDSHRTELLMQFDQNADQYQLIGGRRSPRDATMLAAIVREIDEEVADDLTYKTDYQLDLVIDDMVVDTTLSRTFGALTQYHFTVYHMQHLTQPLTLQAHDRWVDAQALVNGDIQIDGQIITRIASQLYQQMHHIVRLDHLASSFQQIT